MKGMPEQTPRRGRKPMQIGEHGVVRMTDQGNGRWRACCRFRDHDGIHLIERRTPAHLREDPGGASAKAELIREVDARRRLLGFTELAPRQRLNVSPHGHYVYIIWGNDRQRPLYVGRSTNVLRRIGNHVDRWGRQIRDVELVCCKGEAEMILMEESMISNLCPLWNVKLNGRGTRWDL